MMERSAVHLRSRPRMYVIVFITCAMLALVLQWLVSATGDLSAVMSGTSPCGRSNTRIKGWMGRADQTTKIKGMFVRPEQVAALVARHDEVDRARVVASRQGEMDVMTVRIETEAKDTSIYESSVLSTLKLRGAIELVRPGELPRDGVVIEDQRHYD